MLDQIQPSEVVALWGKEGIGEGGYVIDNKTTRETRDIVNS